MKRMVDNRIGPTPGPNYPEWRNPNLRIPDEPEFSVLRQKIREALAREEEIMALGFPRMDPLPIVKPGQPDVAMDRILDNQEGLNERSREIRREAREKGERIADAVLTEAQRLIEVIQAR